MNNIKPIETEYKGYRFRSRLEARWAVFFDAVGAKWEYEPEGFQLKDGTRYLPDFLLHGVRGRGANKEGDIYIEVKGILTEEDLHKIEMFPMPIIIFGQIPDATWKEGFYSDGTHYAHWAFDYNKDDNDRFYNLLYSEGDDYWTEPVAGKGGGLVLDYPDNPYDFVDDGLTAEAYKAAKQARFEHGECGYNHQINRPQQQKKKTASPGDELMSKLSTLPPGDEKIAQILKECQRISEMKKHGRFEDAPSWAIELHYLHSLESLGYEYTGTLDWEKIDWQRKACNEVFKAAGYTEIDPVTGLLMRTEYTKGMYRPSKDIVRFIDTLDGEVRKEIVKRFMSPGEPTWEEEIQLLDLYRETGFEPSGTLEAEEAIRAAIKKNKDIA